ncbi:hypothetical protein FOZ61_003451 [Perkinsus olseni]|uniref:Reticulon-like protein n=1 Tax=Perkinsus olseni TaxID=32597 RepID=A0A7J6LPG7_PEROL|nr:hypothetical protein FOZ61_003451 [Perkinsus olseni]KAF4666440.1 hypothetical protein FOL46_003079 [Perkinsus olseni]
MAKTVETPDPRAQTPAEAPVVAEVPKKEDNTCGSCCSLGSCSVLSWENPLPSGMLYTLLNVGILISSSEDPAGWAVAFVMWIVIPAGLLFKFNVVPVPTCCPLKAVADMDPKKTAAGIHARMTSLMGEISDIFRWENPMKSAQVFALYMMALKMAHHLGFRFFAFVAVQILFLAVPIRKAIARRSAKGCAIKSFYHDTVEPKMACAKSKAQQCLSKLPKTSVAELKSWENPQMSGVALVLANIAIISVSAALCMAGHLVAKLIAVAFIASFAAKSFGVEIPKCSCAPKCDGKDCEAKLTKAVTCFQTVMGHVREIVFWEVPAKNVNAILLLYVLSFALSLFGITGLVLLSLNCYALFPLAKKQPAYKEKVEPAFAKVSESLKKVEAKVASMIERVPKPKAE